MENRRVVEENPAINRDLNQADQANTGLRVIERTRCWLYIFTEKEVIVTLSIFIIVYLTLSGDKCITALLVTFFILHAKKYLM